MTEKFKYVEAMLTVMEAVPISVYDEDCNIEEGTPWGIRVFGQDNLYTTFFFVSKETRDEALESIRQLINNGALLEMKITSEDGKANLLRYPKAS